MARKKKIRIFQHANPKTIPSSLPRTVPSSSTAPGPLSILLLLLLLLPSISYFYRLPYFPLLPLPSPLPSPFSFLSYVLTFLLCRPPSSTLRLALSLGVFVPRRTTPRIHRPHSRHLISSWIVIPLDLVPAPSSCLVYHDKRPSWDSCLPSGSIVIEFEIALRLPLPES